MSSGLFDTPGLAPIYAAALQEPTIDSATLAHNIRLLIVRFGSKVETESTSGTAIQAARYLHSISSRAARMIVDRSNPDQLAVRQSVSGNEAKVSWENKKATSVKHLSDKEKNPGRYNGGDFSSEVDSDEEDDDGTLTSRERIERAKLFLLQSKGYGMFKAELLDFVHRPYEERLYAALQDSAITSESGTPGSSEAKVAWSRELAWVPSSLFNFGCEVKSLKLNRLKGFVEDALGEVWDWWPLQQRVLPLEAGYTRLSWITVSQC